MRIGRILEMSVVPRRGLKRKWRRARRNYQSLGSSGRLPARTWQATSLELTLKRIKISTIDQRSLMAIHSHQQL
jgi:hypothetical protein